MIINDIHSLLDDGEEKDTMRLVVERGIVTYEDDTKRWLWFATVEYFHDGHAVTGGGFGSTPDEACVDLVRIITIGKEAERGGPEWLTQLVGESRPSVLHNPKTGEKVGADVDEASDRIFVDYTLPQDFG